MLRGEARSEVRGPAVDGEGVLHQVVGPDAEEAGFTRQFPGDRNRRRNFDHDPDGNVPAEFQAFVLEFGLCLGDHCLARAQLLE